MSIFEALPTLLVLTATLLILAVLSRQVSLRTQLVTLYLTGSADMAAVVVFLVFIPGILVHEASHWLVAKLLGLKTSRFRVWPEPRGKQIGLGSVSVQSGGTWRDSIVGLAPLFVGTLLIALIGAQIFRSDLMIVALTQGRWLDSIRAFFQAMSTADGFLWAYLLFAIGNTMLPSSSDRQPVKAFLLYLAFAALIYFVVGLPIEPMTAALGWIIPAFQIVISALGFTIILNIIVLGVLFVLELLFSALRRA